MDTSFTIKYIHNWRLKEWLLDSVFEILLLLLFIWQEGISVLIPTKQCLNVKSDNSNWKSHL